MKWQNYGNRPFDEKTVIWRYMDTSRFLSLVTESTLYFPTIFQLNDPFEGLENENGELLATFFGQLCGRIGKMSIEEAACGLPAYRSTERRLAQVKAIEKMGARDRGKMARIIPKRFDLLQRLIRCTALVSCWHINDYQSAAMWGLYCKSGEGIAIKSTAGALAASLGEAGKQMTISTVLYKTQGETTDLQPFNDFVPTISSLFQKRKSFEHENELRVVQSDWRKPERVLRDELQDPASLFDRKKIPLYRQRVADAEKRARVRGGRSCGVDLNLLIDEVHVSPIAGSWVAPALEKVLAGLKPLAKKVVPSNLYTLS